MDLIATDLLLEAKGLSIPFSAAGILTGLLLWLFGWWGYRFWFVLAATTAAGLWGLVGGLAQAGHPLVVALLLAVTAGILAVPLARMVVFVVGGVTCWLVVQALLPAWPEPIACLVVGGLLSLPLFRAWVMALTSLAGTLVTAYSTLLLLDKLGKVDAAAWAGKNGAWLSWALLGAAALGWLTQFLLDAWALRRKKRREEAAAAARQKEQEELARAREKQKKPPPPPPSLWARIVRKAG